MKNNSIYLQLDTYVEILNVNSNNCIIRRGIIIRLFSNFDSIIIFDHGGIVKYYVNVDNDMNLVLSMTDDVLCRN